MKIACVYTLYSNTWSKIFCSLYIDIDIPPISSEINGYDQLGLTTNKNVNTSERHYYDLLPNLENTSLEQSKLNSKY